VDRTAEAVSNESRFASDVEHLASTFAHADRRAVWFLPRGLFFPASARVSSRLQPRVELRGGSRRAIDALFCRERRLVAGGPAAKGSNAFSACDRKERLSQSLDRRQHRIRKRAFIPLASPGSILGNSASRTIVSPHSPGSMMIPGSEAATGER
jgi:hypothetical protein